jgi:enoyl-CoA hydratase
MEADHCCDERGGSRGWPGALAAENARMGLSEPKRGIIPRGGGLARLPRLIPLRAAMEILLTEKRPSSRISQTS